jgi:hypothetical protein
VNQATGCRYSVQTNEENDNETNGFTFSFSAALTVKGAEREQTFTGVITDSMCGANRKMMMKITPDAKCASA